MRALLQQWFTEQRWAKVYPILNSRDESPPPQAASPPPPPQQPCSVSLRCLDMLSDALFVSECHRRNVPLVYWIEDERRGAAGGDARRLFNLPVELQATQSFRRKKNMEPFARTNPKLPGGGCFEFGYGDARMRTNVAQLEFFKFLIENCVVDWLSRYRDKIVEIKSFCEEERRRHLTRSS